MSNPDKRWSWGGALGRSTGTAMAAATAGYITGSLGGPLGASLGAATLGALGFCGGMIGAGLGHWWDDMYRNTEQFGSGALFTLVVGGPPILFAALFLAWLSVSSQDIQRVGITPVVVVVVFLSIVASAAKSLLDDLHYVYIRGGRQDRTF